MQFIQTKNYQKGNGVPKLGFVLHGTLGGYKGAVEWLLNSNRQNPTSAAVVIGRNEGEITELVKPKDISWHAGIISNPSKNFATFALKNPNGTYINPNQYLIGIEFAWGYDDDNDGTVEAQEKTLTPWQYKAGMEYIKYAMKEAGMVTSPVMFSHHEIASYKQDNMLFAIPAIKAAIALPIPAPVPSDKGLSIDQVRMKLQDLFNKFHNDVDNLLNSLR